MTDNIFKKLQTARVELASLPIKKSGLNKFAGYHYFELSDYLPSVQIIFNRMGLCGVIKFTREIALLTIYNTENTSEFIEFSSPMAEANLKGTHPIQNLGAVESYSTRYLWQTAMEVLENDALEATTGKEKQPEPVNYKLTLEAAKTPEQLAKVWESIPNADKPSFTMIKDAMKAKLTPQPPEAV